MEKFCWGFITLVGIHCHHGRRKRGAGDASLAVEKSAGDVPQKLVYFRNFFLDMFKNLHFPTVYGTTFSIIFKIQWLNSEEKLNFGCMWVWVPMHSVPPKQNFVAVPLIVTWHVNVVPASIRSSFISPLKCLIYAYAVQHYLFSITIGTYFCVRKFPSHLDLLLHGAGVKRAIIYGQASRCINIFSARPKAVYPLAVC